MPARTPLAFVSLTMPSCPSTLLNIGGEALLGEPGLIVCEALLLIGGGTLLLIGFGAGLLIGGTALLLSRGGVGGIIYSPGIVLNTNMNILQDQTLPAFWC